MNKPVGVLGNPVVDHVISIPHLPVEANSPQEVKTVSVGPGGAANILIAGNRIGLSMRALGSVGVDEAGYQLIQTLYTEGIDVNGVLHVESEHTTEVYILVDASQNYALLGFHGAVGPSTLPSGWRSMIEESAALYFDGWAYAESHEAITLGASHFAASAGVPVFFDPGSQYPHFDPEWLKSILENTSVLLLTEDEARGITEKDSSAASLGKTLLDTGPDLVVIKRGPAGCVICSAEDEVIEHPGFRVTVQDTIGAGDVLSAAVIYAYLHSYTLAEIAILANAAGAAAVSKFGTGLNTPTRQEIVEILKQSGQIIPFK